MRTSLWSLALAAGAAVSLSAGAAQAQVKIGLLTTLSGPEAVLGTDIRDGFQLAITEKNGKLGGVETTVVTGDDQTKPDIGRQVATKMLESDGVDIVTGPVFSNVLLGIAKPVLDSGAFLISVNAGPSELAGKQCNPNFFAVSWANDNTDEAGGQLFTDQKIKRVYLMAPNYPAGRDKLTGFKRFYKGEVVKEVYTQFGQLDYAGEIADIRSVNPDAVFVFYPGGMAINFLKQFHQAGLSMPLSGDMNTFDRTVLPAVGDAAAGVTSAAWWAQDMDTPANKQFTADFEKTYHRLPSPYAAQSYDAAMLIDSALRKTSPKDKAAFRAALAAADFSSVRGSFKFGPNHYPIQDWYVTKVEKDDQGRWVPRLGTKIWTAHQDAYAGECKMSAK